MPLYMKRPSPLTSRVVRPAGKAVPFQFKASAVPKMSLKSGPASITSKFVAAPMMNPTISAAGSSGSMGNVLGNAAKGALIGGGAKLAYDALTKKPTVSPKTPSAIAGITKQIGNTAVKAGTGALTKAVTPAAKSPTQPTTRPTTGAPTTNTEETPTQTTEEEAPVEETPAEEIPVEEPVFQEEPVYEDTAPLDDSSGDFWDSWDMGWRKGGLITMMKRGGIAHLADGGLPEDAIEMNDYPGVYISYGADGQPVFMDESGYPVEDPTAGAMPEGEVSDEFLAESAPPDYTSEEPVTYRTVTGDDGSTYTVGSDNSVTSSPATDWTQGASGFLPPELMSSLKGALPAAGAGALLAAILGSDFGSAGRQNQGVDMSKLSTLTPRTTDFGIGPARFVTYDEYGSQDQMPDIYGGQLYGDLGTPMPVESQPIDDYAGIMPSEPGTMDYSDSDRVEAFADGGQVDGYYSYGTPVDPFQIMQGQAMKQGGLPAYSRVPVAGGRLDFRQGSAVHGPGDGQSDDIPAMLADGEYVFDADTVAALGNGSTKAGAAALDKMREQIRKHKRSAPVHKIPPPAKSPLAYLKGIK